MDIDKETERKLQEIIAGLSKGNIDIATKFIELNSKEKDQLMYLSTINFLLTLSAKYRGKVIDITIFLEMVLAQILSKYFTQDEEKESVLNSFVFDRMQLSSKFNLLKKILKTNHIKIWEKYDTDIKEIGELIDFRNNLAHSMLDTTPDYINKVIGETKDIVSEYKKRELDEIQIIYYTDLDSKTEKVSQKQVDDFYAKCYEKIELIQKISGEIMK
jgi:hypothetical protein